ncbi:MAG: hypothetical protein ACE5IY_15980 [bacterium]
MQSEVTVFRKLFLWLWDSCKKPWELNGTAQKIYELTPTRNALIGKAEELEGLLPREGKVQSDMRNRFLYLEPPEEGLTFVPVLSMKCDFGRNVPEVRIKMALFFLDQWGALQTVGFRYESPEGAGSTRTHHYYHVQLITGFHKNGTFTPNQAGYQNEMKQIFWSTDILPTKHPAFPLDANDPVKLLLCLLVSLYGLSYIGSLRSESGLGDDLEDYLKGMNLEKFDPIMWYWKVSPEDSSRKGYTIYDTQKTPEEFRKIMQRQHPGHNIAGITREEYEKEPERKRKTC